MSSTRLVAHNETLFADVLLEVLLEKAEQLLELSFAILGDLRRLCNALQHKEITYDQTEFPCLLT